MRISTAAQHRIGAGAAGGECELTDAAVAHAVRRGVEVGVPTVLLLVACVALLAGQGLGVAVAIAVVPGLFAGPYFGTIVTLTRAARVADIDATVHPLRRPSEAAASREAA